METKGSPHLPVVLARDSVLPKLRRASEVLQFICEWPIVFIVESTREGLRVIIEDDDFRSEHEGMLTDGMKLVGGGQVWVLVQAHPADHPHGDFKATWGSKTCIEKFGYDQPGDPYEANLVLCQVIDAIMAWTRDVLGFQFEDGIDTSKISKRFSLLLKANEK